LTTLNLLLIEDNPDDAALIERELARLGTSVRTHRVETEEELSAALASERWDAVIADYRLPSLTGMQALQMTRALDAEIPFILVSGTVEEEIAVEAMRQGAHDYIMKSNLVRLGPALRRELHEAGVRRERAAAIEAIKASEKRFRALIENGSDVIGIMSADGITRFTSPSSERVLGYRPEELLGTSPFERLHPDDVERLLTVFKEGVAQPGSLRRVEYRYRHKSGRWLWIESVAQNLLHEDEIRGVVVMSRDITERKLLQEQLADAERLSALGRLAATVAHEFNNVLMGIQPFCDVIRKISSDRPKVVNATNAMSGAVARGRRVTQDILRFTHPAHASLQKLDVLSWIDGYAGEVRQVLGDAHPLVLETPDEPMTITADAHQLTQVMMNLVLNARDASPAGGRIRITAERFCGARVFPFGVIPDDREYMHISVEDNGSGIEKEVLPRIFEPLFTTKRSGTGLGLAVAYQIVKQHDGYIFVESTRGSGTTFHLFIPSEARQTHTATPALPDTVLPSEEQRLHVLLVEDDATVADGTASLLKFADHKVTVARDGATGLEYAASIPFDVAILDVNLPDMTGIEVFEQLRRTFPDLPIVFATAHYQPSALANVIGNAPAVACLMKPYDASALQREISRVVGEAKRG
jgi:two-component system cell cycle sensor histidine kinase/response regulator CckA